MIASFRSGIRTLTIFPFPGKDSHDFSASFKWFSIIGFILGALLYGFLYLLKPASGFLGTEVVALLLLLAITIMTRGFHLDGLADWADGFLGNLDKKRTLEIMKDPHVGTFGIVALIILLMMKWIFFERLIVEGEGFLIIAPYLLSRNLMVSLAVRYDYAGNQAGLGKSFIDKTRRSDLYFSMITAFIILSLLYGVLGILFFTTGFILERFLGFLFSRKLGGMTGDLLGAACEISETGLLLTCFIIMKIALENLSNTAINFGLSVYF